MEGLPAAAGWKGLPAEGRRSVPAASISRLRDGIAAISISEFRLCGCELCIINR